MSVTQYHYPTAISGWDAQEVDAIYDVIKSDRYTMGYQCESLEKEFAAYHGMKYGIGTNSGSSANLISIAAMVELGILERGTALTVPALAWSTTFAPIVQYGLGIVLIDSDSTWNAYRAPDVVVSILGNAQHKPGQPVLCDNCESVGARDETGALSGTQGICNTFSFFFSHQMSAIEGGMILTNDEDVVRMCRKLRAHGWTRDTRIAQEFSDEYRFEVHGFNVRPQEINSAIARVQLRKLDARIAARSANYNHWVSATDGLPLLHPAIRGTPSFFGIHFQVESKDVRAKLAKALRAAGIDCRPPVAGSFRKQPYGARWANQNTPNADKIHDCGIMLGNPPMDATVLIDHAVAVMREVL